LNLPQIVFIVKKNPIFLIEFLTLFAQQIPYKFSEPLTNRQIEDDLKNEFLTKFFFFIFLNSQNYTNNKNRKKGRVKRKISRKLVLKNSIID
jgi:hypothetical protein